jgi:hypothetical protein
MAGTCAGTVDVLQVERRVFQDDLLRPAAVVERCDHGLEPDARAADAGDAVGVGAEGRRLCDECVEGGHFWSRVEAGPSYPGLGLYSSARRKCSACTVRIYAAKRPSPAGRAWPNDATVARSSATRATLAPLKLLASSPAVAGAGPGAVAARQHDHGVQRRVLLDEARGAAERLAELNAKRFNTMAAEGAAARGQGDTLQFLLEQLAESIRRAF